MNLLTAVYLMAVTHVLHSAAAAGDVHWYAWQIINLVGAPLAAAMVVRAWINDITRWAEARSRSGL